MNIKEYYDPVFDAMAGHIEQTREDNDTRHAFWKFMSAERWLNREFEDMVWECLGYIELEVNNARGRANIEKIAPELVEHYVLLKMSAWVMGNRDLSDRLERNTLADVKRAADELNYVLRDIDDMKRISDRDNRSTGRNERSTSWNRSDDRSQRSAPRGMASSRGAPTTNRPSSGITGALESKERNGREVPQSDRNDRDSRNDRSTREAPRQEREETPARSDNSFDRTARQEPNTTSRLDGIDFTLAHPYDSFTSSGETWKPAHKCDWTLTPEAGKLKAFDTAFNPRKKMRFYVTNKSNVVREELRDMTKDMEYLRHELKVGGRTRITDTANPERTPVENPGYIAPGSLPDESIMIQRAASSQVKMFEGNTNFVSSREEGELIAQFEQLRLAHQTTVYNYMVTTPVVVANQTNLDQLRDIADSVNLSDTVLKMKDCINNVDGGAWEYVNRRLTAMVNNITKNHYGLIANITDFTEDYESLIKWLKAKNETIARTFSQYTSYIPAVAVLELDSNSRKNWLMGTLDLSEEEFIARDPNVVCFATPYSVAMVNFTYGDIGLNLSEDSQRINAAKNEYLYTLLKNIIKCNSNAVEGGSTYLFTRDRYRLAIVVAPDDKDDILLRVISE
jgi:hypothetical protein